MSDIGYITLDEIVNNVIIDEYGTENASQYQRYLNWAVRGAKKLTHSVGKTTKEAVLTLNNLRQAPLPEDYVDYVSVWKKVGPGRVPLIFSPKLTSQFSLDACGNPIPDPECESNGPVGYDTAHYRNGEFVGRFFGVGGGNGERVFTIDHENGVIKFSAPGPAESGDTLYMTYKHDGINYSGSTTVHVYFEETMVDWIHYMRLRHKPGASQGDKMIAKSTWEGSLTEAREMINGFTLDEFIDRLRLHNKRTYKM